MKNLLLLTLLLGSFSSFAQKTVDKIAYDDFVKQVTNTKTDNDHVKIAFWLPAMFWDVVANKNKEFTPEMVTEVKDALGEYTIFCVVDANMSNPMDVTTASDDQMRKSLSVEFEGKTYKPVAEKDLSEMAGIMKTNFEPMFAAMLGTFGNGMKMYFFHINDRNGDPLLDPYKEQSFTLSVTGAKLNYRLPLASVMDDKICPNDKQALPGNYKYCPYHGTELK